MTAKVCTVWWLGLVGVLAAYAPRLEAADGGFTPQHEPGRQPVELRDTAVSSLALLRAEARLDSCVARVEKSVRRQGEAVVAERMARELGVEPAALLNEQALLGCLLGDLLIAHSIRANAHAGVTAGQLVELHSAGTSWSEIAVRLGLRLNHVVRGLINETRVAVGLSRGDGKVAAMVTERAAEGMLTTSGGRATGATGSGIAARTGSGPVLRGQK